MPNKKRSLNLYDKDSIDRFWKHIRIDESGCWIWIGARNNKGYGLINRVGKLILAHRFSYRAYFGKFDESNRICHRCDTPACCNPDHLFQGTDSDNMKDCVSKGRLKIPIHIGESHPRASITKDTVNMIRELKSTTDMTEQKIAEFLGTTKRIVNCVSSGKTWKQQKE